MSDMNNTNVMAAEIAKVNEAMLQEEKKVEKAYSEIGKLYVALHASDYESEFKPMFEVIEQAENAVRECRARVREIRGVVCCDKCGSDMPKGNAFCSVCGAALTTGVEQVDRDNLVKCEVCGKYVAKDTSFCTSCGMPMKPISERVEAPVVEEPVVEEPVVEETPVAEEPAVEEAPAVEEIPVVVEEAPAVEETPVIEEAPVVEEPAAVEEEIDLDKTVIAPSVFAKAATPVAPVVEEKPAPVAEETPSPVAQEIPAPVAPVVPPVVDDMDATVAMRRPAVVQPPVVDDLEATTAMPRPTPAPAANTCTRCGATLRQGMLFCTSCGQRVAPAPAPAAATTKVCAKCGKEIAATAKFCIGCGSRVD